MEIPLWPSFNALLNILSACSLGIGYHMIRAGNRRMHKRCMITALFTSAAFVVSYIFYHAHVGSVPYGGIGIARVMYFTILFSHSVLAVIIIPMIAIALFQAYSQRFERHRQIARWTFPLWLYVSTSGFLVYLFLYII